MRSRTFTEPVQQAMKDIPDGLPGRPKADSRGWAGRLEELWASHLLRIKEDAETKSALAQAKKADRPELTTTAHGPRRRIVPMHNPGPRTKKGKFDDCNELRRRGTGERIKFVMPKIDGLEVVSMGQVDRYGFVNGQQTKPAGALQKFLKSKI